MSNQDNKQAHDPYGQQQNDAQMLVTQALFLCNERREILLLQLPDNRWQLPGGKVKRHEQWADGIKRELIEETGITDLQIHRPLYVDSWYTPSQDYYRAYFLATTMAREITLSGDHVHYEWIDQQTNLDNYTFTHATVKQHIKKFFAEYDV